MSTDKRTTKEQLTHVMEAWVATADPTVENVFWLNGHCFLLKQAADGYWDVEEL